MRALTISAFIFLLGIATYTVAAVTCPEEEDISPCECDEDSEFNELTVSCFDSSTTLSQLKRAFSSLKQRKNIVIQLDGLKLGALPSDFFHGTSVKKLEISHCELDSLTDGTGPALKGLENSLEELIIISSFSEENVKTKLSLSHLSRLTELDLSYNSITELGNDWFQDGPESLTHVTFSNNGIQKIGDKGFTKLSNLKSLSLDGNRFGDIKRSMLPHFAAKLETLELDNNALTSIPDDLFLLMPSLRSISLRTNGITRLEKRTWLTVWSQLQSIHLEGNPLECDDHMDWLFNVKMSKSIFGKCSSPRNRAGMNLIDIIELRAPKSLTQRI